MPQKSAQEDWTVGVVFQQKVLLEEAAMERGGGTCLAFLLLLLPALVTLAGECQSFFSKLLRIMLNETEQELDQQLSGKWQSDIGLDGCSRYSAISKQTRPLPTSCLPVDIAHGLLHPGWPDSLMLKNCQGG